MKLKIYFYFLLVVISYLSQNRGCKLENVASLSHQKNRNADKKFIQYLPKVTFQGRKNPQKLIKTKLFHARHSIQEIFVNILFTSGY